MLAAIRRAESHSHSHARGASWSEIVRHLGLPQGSPRVGGIRIQVDELVATGALECSVGIGHKRWNVTAKGRRRLSRAQGQGRSPELPEAPQHRVWRTSSEEAKERIDGLAIQVQQTLTRGQQLIKGGKGTARDWAGLSMTLRRQCAQLAWAIYCIHEWLEPDDTIADVPEAARRRELGLVGADLTDTRSRCEQSKGLPGSGNGAGAIW